MVNFYALLPIVKIYQKIFGYSGLLGLFFLTIYSYISNFFIAHNFTHNSILVLFGLILLVYELLKKNKKQKKNLLYFLLIFLILFISALIYKHTMTFLTIILLIVFI